MSVTPPWDRRFSFALLLVLIPIGIGTKTYTGPLAGWIGGYGGDILYEIAWIALVLLLNPRLPLTPTCLWVFGLTSLGEFSQLWHPAWLARFRASLWGRLSLGSSFRWADFPWYGLGCGLCWLLFWGYHGGIDRR